MVKCCDSNTTTVSDDILWHIHSYLFIQIRENITLCPLTQKILFPPGIPVWSSFNSVLGHITHSDTNVQQRLGEKLGANGWVIKRDKSHGAPLCLIIQIPWEDTHGCFCYSAAAERLICCIMGVAIQRQGNQNTKWKCLWRILWLCWLVSVRVCVHLLIMETPMRW